MKGMRIGNTTRVTWHIQGKETRIDRSRQRCQLSRLGVSKALLWFYQEYLKIICVIRHVSSCEIEPYKRKWSFMLSFMLSFKVFWPVTGVAFKSNYTYRSSQQHVQAKTPPVRVDLAGDLHLTARAKVYLLANETNSTCPWAYLRTYTV